MKIDDIIQLGSEEELKKVLQDLGNAGFHAVRDSVYSKYHIRITGVPEEEFLVQARDQNGRQQKAYCVSLEEAEEIAEEYGMQYEFVETLRGYAGEWETVSQSW